jgi:hypothetical protein
MEVLCFEKRRRISSFSALMRTKRALGDGAGDRLADPPHGVRDELEVAADVEAFGRLDQAEVSLVDQLGQGEALVLVHERHVDHELEVRAHEAVHGPRIPLLDAAQELYFLGAGEQGVLVDVLDVLVVERCSFPGFHRCVRHGGVLGCGL